MYKSKANSVNQPSCSYFTFHQQEWKPGQGSVFLRQAGQACRRAGVLLAHVMSMQKWHTGVYKTFLGFYRNSYSTHLMLKLIWQMKDCFQTKLCGFFPLAVYTKFCSSPCQAHLLKAAAHPGAAVAACNAPQHHHKSLQSDRYICRQSRLLQ